MRLRTPITVPSSAQPALDRAVTALRAAWDAQIDFQHALGLHNLTYEQTADVVRFLDDAAKKSEGSIDQHSTQKVVETTIEKMNRSFRPRYTRYLKRYGVT